MRRGCSQGAKLLLFVLCAALLLSSCGAEQSSLPLSDRISNCGEVVAGIRRALRERDASVTLRFDYGSDIYDELNAVVDDWFEAALAETANPAEGDYLRCQLGGCKWESSREYRDGRWHYAVTLRPVCYTSPEQEQAVTERVSELLSGFGFDRRTGDYEKLKAIYDALRGSVSYDRVHRKNPHSHLKSTAYGALVLHSATCQGYCAALYRLLREAGINCRVVTGAAEGEEALHAWIIAELEGQYYNLDPTWDAGTEPSRYFLLGSAEFGDHVPGERFQSAEFTARCPMAAERYRKEGTL